MDEAPPAIATARPFLRTLPGRLTPSLPLVFLIGVPTLLITRRVFEAHSPNAFVGTLPSISETASAGLAAVIFKWAILAATVCIVTCWSLVLRMNRHRLAHLALPGQDLRLTGALNLAASLIGMAAGLFLGLLATVNLRSGHDLHILFSVLFFVTQVGAFLLDTWCSIRLRRQCRALDGPPERIAMIGKLAVAGTTLTTALFFLYMYNAKDVGAFGDRYLAQQIYVASEYLLAILSFAYPLPTYFEVRRHHRIEAALLNAQAMTDRNPSGAANPFNMVKWSQPSNGNRQPDRPTADQAAQ